MPDLQLRVDADRQRAWDALDEQALTAQLDDWRCVMKECARHGPEGIARMAERICEQLLDELRARAAERDFPF